ncbi:MAG: CDP-glucose 4,6-dehydratase, partial [Betaproteobacteria bacterium]
MENLEIASSFWSQKKVFVTGHTGFKGGWLSLWLSILGAKVYGYSLSPTSEETFFNLANVQTRLEANTIADIRDREALRKAMQVAKPDLVFHLAAQPLVRRSYVDPLETYSVNIMGTVNVFEAIRETASVKAVVNVTTDKCYENREWSWPYRETDALGGHDPYSSSKACSELISSAYRTSFFNMAGIS